MDLNSGERVIFRGHPSWRSILGFYFKAAIVTIVIAAAIAVATNLFGDVRSGLVAGVVAIGFSLALALGFIKRIATTYTITDRRLHIKRGIVSREIQETRLERVQNVNHSQSVFERIVGIGTVDFDTAAGDDYEFRFAGVADPGAVVARVDAATETAERT